MSQEESNSASHVPEVEYLFVAKLDNARDLSQLLKAISIKEVLPVFQQIGVDHHPNFFLSHRSTSVS